MSVIKKLNSEAIVAFHVAYAKLPGSDPMCALFLSQVSYWCARSEDGVAWITHQAMYDQTGMSRKQQDRAAAYWVSMGIMEKFIKGIPPKIHYFVSFEKLEQLILDAQFRQNDMSERDNLDVQKGQQVLSERGKTSREDSLETHLSADEQQPEKAASSSLTRSQTSALSPEQPLSSRAPQHSQRRPAPTFEIPANLQVPEFLEAWAEWLEFRRKDLKKPVTEMAGKKQLSALAAVGPLAAITAINNSIASGYTGLFPKPVSGRQPSAPQVFAKL